MCGLVAVNVSDSTAQGSLPPSCKFFVLFTLIIIATCRMLSQNCVLYLGNSAQLNYLNDNFSFILNYTLMDTLFYIFIFFFVSLRKDYLLPIMI